MNVEIPEVNYERVAMASEAAQEAIAFETELTEPTLGVEVDEGSGIVPRHWIKGADKNILAKLDEITKEFSHVDLRMIFRYRATVKVLGRYFATNEHDMALAEKYRDKIRLDCLAAQQQIVAAYSRRETSPAARSDLREAQLLLLDCLEIFCNASGLAAEKIDQAPLKPFG